MLWIYAVDCKDGWFKEELQQRFRTTLGMISAGHSLAELIVSAFKNDTDTEAVICVEGVIEATPDLDALAFLVTRRDNAIVLTYTNNIAAGDLLFLAAQR